MYKNIVLAYDGSTFGQKALLDCKELAQWNQSQLSLVAVMPSNASFVAMEGAMYNPEMEAQESAKFEAVLADGLRRLEEAGYKASAQLLVGDAVQEIARYARKVDADLIVVGHKHLDSWAARWWRGSISAALIEHAPCSVLCVITP